MLFEELEAVQKPLTDSQIRDLEKEMKKAAKEWRFEEAARLRDQIKLYRDLELL